MVRYPIKCLSAVEESNINFRASLIEMVDDRLESEDGVRSTRLTFKSKLKVVRTDEMRCLLLDKEFKQFCWKT